MLENLVWSVKGAMRCRRRNSSSRTLHLRERGGPRSLGGTSKSLGACAVIIKTDHSSMFQLHRCCRCPVGRLFLKCGCVEMVRLSLAVGNRRIVRLACWRDVSGVRDFWVWMWMWKACGMRWGQRRRTRFWVGVYWSTLDNRYACSPTMQKSGRDWIV